MRRVTWAAIALAITLAALLPDTGRAQEKTPDLEMLLNLDLFRQQKTGTQQTPATGGAPLLDLIDQLTEMRAIGLFDANRRMPAPDAQPFPDDTQHKEGNDEP